MPFVTVNLLSSCTFLQWHCPADPLESYQHWPCILIRDPEELVELSCILQQSFLDVHLLYSFKKEKKYMNQIAQYFQSI